MTVVSIPIMVPSTFLHHGLVVRKSMLLRVQLAVAWLTIIQIISFMHDINYKPPLVLYSSTSPIANQNFSTNNLATVRKQSSSRNQSIWDNRPTQLPNVQLQSINTHLRQYELPHSGWQTTSSQSEKQADVQQQQRNTAKYSSQAQFNNLTSQNNHEPDALIEMGSGQGPVRGHPASQVDKKHVDKVVDDTEEGDDDNDEDDEDYDYKDSSDTGSGNVPLSLPKKKTGESAMKNQGNSQLRNPNRDIIAPPNRQPSLVGYEITSTPSMSMVAPITTSPQPTKFDVYTTVNTASLTEVTTIVPPARSTSSKPELMYDLSSTTINSQLPTEETKLPSTTTSPINVSKQYIVNNNMTSPPTNVKVPYVEVTTTTSKPLFINNSTSMAPNPSTFYSGTIEKATHLLNGSLGLTPNRNRHPMHNDSSFLRPNNSSKAESEDYDYEDFAEDDDSADLSNFEEGEPAENGQFNKTYPADYDIYNRATTLPTTPVDKPTLPTSATVAPAFVPIALSERPHTNLTSQLRSPTKAHNTSVHHGESSSSEIGDEDEDDEDEDEDDEDLESDDDDDVDNLNGRGNSTHRGSLSTVAPNIRTTSTTRPLYELPVKQIDASFDPADSRYKLYSTTTLGSIISPTIETPTSTRPLIKLETTTSRPAIITNAATLLPWPSTTTFTTDSAIESTTSVPVTTKTTIMTSTTSTTTTTTTSTTTTTTTPRPTDTNKSYTRIPNYTSIFPSTTTKRPNLPINYVTTVRSKATPTITKTSNILNYDRALQEDSDGLTKQFVDKAIEVYTATNKALNSAINAVWPPRFDSSTFEPLLDKPFLFMRK